METSSGTNCSINADTNGDNLFNSPNGNSTQSIPISKWTNHHILEWLHKKLPFVYEKHKKSFIDNDITGENFLSNNFNQICLEHLKIDDRNLREQLLNEISLLKIRNEYEFIKRFKSQQFESTNI